MENMKKEELLTLAAERGLKFKSKVTKAEIIAALKAPLAVEMINTGVGDILEDMAAKGQFVREVAPEPVDHYTFSLRVNGIVPPMTEAQRLEQERKAKYWAKRADAAAKQAEKATLANKLTDPDYIATLIKERGEQFARYEQLAEAARVKIRRGHELKGDGEEAKTLANEVADLNRQRNEVLVEIRRLDNLIAAARRERVKKADINTNVAWQQGRAAEFSRRAGK